MNVLKIYLEWKGYSKRKERCYTWIIRRYA